MDLRSAFRDGQDAAADSIIVFANRYGTLEPNLGVSALETVDYWQTKVEELIEATRRKDEGILNARNLDKISREYIGYCFVSLMLDSRTTTLTFTPKSLLGAIWLQWSQSTRHFQGYCPICGIAIIGRKGQITCSDKCRKLKSMESKK